MNPSVPNEARDRLHALREQYRRGLLEDTLPFWTRHAVDRECGGFLFCLDRDGRVVDTDKGLWQHGRFTWLLATLAAEVEPREEWLRLAEHGITFLRKHGFDRDGRMFFQVTREGAPLRKRRYVFTEAFGAIAFAAWARASGDAAAAATARELFDLMREHLGTPGRIPPKVDPETRPMRSLGGPMITLATAQVLRDALADARFDAEVDAAIAEIRRDFMNEQHEAVLETVGEDGAVLDHFDGRTLNPGHAFEAAWFVLAEARRRDDRELRDAGCTMLDWTWRRGWDPEHGGVLSFVGIDGGPVQEYWHDMKFWWPHNEALLATLHAWLATGERRYEDWHRAVHEWSHEHFADREFGEWFGYLRRDGALSSSLKGNLWKGPFHLPRMQLVAWQLLESELAADSG